MFRIVKKCLYSFVAFGFIVALTISPVFAAVEVQSDYMKYSSDFDITSSSGLPTSYNIMGLVEGTGTNWIETSWDNRGYEIGLQIGSGSVQYIGQIANGVTKIIDDKIGLTLNLSLVNNGRNVKVQFLVENLTDVSQIVSLGSSSDVEINENDYAPIDCFSSDPATASGFSMTDEKGAQFNFLGRDTYGVTDVDTFWYGYFNDRRDNLFTQVTEESLYDKDSAFSFSWKDRAIAAGETEAYSVLIGIGPVDKAPTLDPSVFTFNSGSAFGDVLNGQSYPFAGNVSDTENTSGTQVYYAIDDAEPILAYTFTDVPGDFTSSITVPATLSSGIHNVTFFAQDVDGAISSTVSTTMNVTSYSVTWEDEDGTVLETDSDIAYGTTPTYDGSTPTKTADAQYTYTFAGWTPESSAVTGDVTYTATYQENINTYTVTWEDEDGTVLETDSDVAYGTTPTYDGVNPTKTADAQYTYTFAGWTPEIVSVENDTVYKAIYTTEVNVYTVTLFSDEGTVVSPIVGINYGSTVPIPTNPTKTDKIFEGWYLDSDLTEKWDFSTDTLAGDTTLYAKWIDLEVDDNSDSASVTDIDTSDNEETTVVDTGDNTAGAISMYVLLSAMAICGIAISKKSLNQ